MKDANQARVRNSNLEILRIIAIIMIIMHHYAIYSGFIWENSITVNRIIVNIFQMFGKLGVCLFIIISGFFYDKSTFKLKKFIMLLLQVFVYSIIGLMIGVLTNSSELGIMNIIKSIFPTTFGLYWFASCYVLIYIFAPFFKKLIDNISKKDFKILLTLMIAIFGIIAFIPKTKTFFNELIWFIVIYFIGAYIKKYNCNFMENNKIRIVCIILVIIIMNIIMVLLELLSIKLSMISDLVYYFNNINSPLVLILTVLIFTIFSSINIGNNKIVNKVASTTFGIYLLHENVFLRKIIWKQMVRGYNYINSPILIINAICGVLGVFLIALILDIIIDKLLVNNLLKLLSKIWHKMKKLKKYDRFKNSIAKFYNN